MSPELLHTHDDEDDEDEDDGNARIADRKLTLRQAHTIHVIGAGAKHRIDIMGET